MEEQLKEIFNEILGQDLSKFKPLAKERIPGITNAQIKDFYDRQTVRQRMLVRNSKKKFNPIITLKNNHVLFMDSMFITSDNIAIINAIDLFSRKGYIFVKKVRKKRKKKDGTSITGTSITSEDTRDFLQRILSTDKYTEIRTDKGKEFESVFKTFVENTQGLTHKAYEDTPKRLLSVVERYNRTVRNLWEKKKLISNDRIPRNDYIAFGNNIVEVYNNSKHRTIKDTPLNVYNNIDGARRRTKEIYQQKLNQARNQNQEEPLPVGTKVRLYQPNRKTFNKLKPSWSKATYVVRPDSYDPEIKRYTFRNKLYARDFLQVVPENSENLAGDPQPGRRGRRPRPRRNPVRERRNPNF